MKKFSLSAVALLLSALFVFSAFTPVAKAEGETVAVDGTPSAVDFSTTNSTIDKITLTVTNSSGTVTRELTKDSTQEQLNILENTTVKLDYNFTIPDDDVDGSGNPINRITAGQPYTVPLNLPASLKIKAPLTGKLNDSGADFGTYSIGADGVATLIFNDTINDPNHAHSRGGTFHVTTDFQLSGSGSEDPKSLVFTVDGGTVTVPIQVEKQVTKPTINKAKGNYDADTGEITWKVTVNSGNDKSGNGLTNVTVMDTWDAGTHTFLDSEPVTVKMGTGADATIDTDSGKTQYYETTTEASPGKLVFHLGNIAANTDAVITYKTKPTAAVFKTTQTAATVSNTAKLEELNITATNIATIPVNWIDKVGVPDSQSAPTKIAWTITVNKQGQPVPAGATVTDTLPAYLTLDTVTGVKVGGETIGTDSSAVIYYKNEDVTVNGQSKQKVTINFKDSFSDKKDITFTTNIDPNYRNRNANFSNTATLTATNDGGIGGNQSATGNPGIGSNVISKVSNGYDKGTHQITWLITVNANQMNIDNPIVTDTIGARQKFVSVAVQQGAAYVDLTDSDTDKPYYATSGKQWSSTSTQEDLNNPEKVTVYLQSLTNANSPVVLKLITEVTDPDYYAANDGTNKTVSNTANLTSANPAINQDATASQTFTSQTLAKTGSYDYASRTITWTIDVNQNNMAMENTTVTDTIPDGLEFVGGADAVTVKDTNGSVSYSLDNSASPAVPSYAVDGQKLTVKLGTIAVKKTITFKTKVKDSTFAASNSQLSFKNHATLSITGAKDVSVDYTQNVPHTIVDKTNTYVTGERYINWQVLINRNQIPLNDFLSSSKPITITDTLQEGLALDTTSVALYPVKTIDGGKTFTHDGTPVVLSMQNVQYDTVTRKFIFIFPSGFQFKGRAYQLEFTTDVTKELAVGESVTFDNVVTFTGAATDKNSQTNSVMVTRQNSGGAAWGSGFASLKVTKVEQGKLSTKLKDAKFELYSNGTLKGTGFTDSNGELTFNRLIPDQTYTLKETIAPVGYQLDETEKSIKIPADATTAKPIEYAFEDTKKPTSPTGGGGNPSSSEVSSVASGTSSIVSSTSSNPNENIGDDGVGKAGASSKPASGNPNENIGGDGVGKAGGSPKTGESNTYLPIIISLMLAAAIVLILGTYRSTRSKKAQ